MGISLDKNSIVGSIPSSRTKFPQAMSINERDFAFRTKDTERLLAEDLEAREIARARHERRQNVIWAIGIACGVIWGCARSFRYLDISWLPLVFDVSSVLWVLAVTIYMELWEVPFRVPRRFAPCQKFEDEFARPSVNQPRAFALLFSPLAAMLLIMSARIVIRSVQTWLQ